MRGAKWIPGTVCSPVFAPVSRGNECLRVRIHNVGLPAVFWVLPFACTEQQSGENDSIFLHLLSIRL